MSDNIFERERLVAAPPAMAGRFFRDAEAWFRLNPEWEVLSFEHGVLKVRYERSETEAEGRVAVDIADDGGSVRFEGGPPRHIELAWHPVGKRAMQLRYREVFDEPLATERRAELSVWLDAAAGYLALAARSDRRARLGRWLLDKAWLRMSPTARRVGLIVVAMEALALLLFVAVLIVDRIAG